MKKLVIYIAVLFMTLAVFSPCLATGNQSAESAVQKKDPPIFADIERAFSTGNIGVIAGYFSSQIYLSLSTGVNGFYSSNQAYYILQDFFQLYQPIAFKYTQRSESENGFVTGMFSFESKNKKGTAQIFISVEYSGAKWKIPQITIK